MTKHTLSLTPLFALLAGSSAGAQPENPAQASPQPGLQVEVSVFARNN